MILLSPTIITEKMKPIRPALKKTKQCYLTSLVNPANFSMHIANILSCWLHNFYTTAFWGSSGNVAVLLCSGLGKIYLQ